MGGGVRMGSTQASRDAAAVRIEDAQAGNVRSTAGGMAADRGPGGLKHPWLRRAGSEQQEEPPEGKPSGGSLFPTLSVRRFLAYGSGVVGAGGWAGIGAAQVEPLRPNTVWRSLMSMSKSGEMFGSRSKNRL